MDFIFSLGYNLFLMTKSKQMERVRELIAIWLSKIRVDNDCDYFDINKDAEDIARRLLNLVLELDLINLNQEQQRNFPGIDLADQEAGIAVQVTSERSSTKIKHCLNLFVKNQLHTSYPQGLRFLILHPVETKFDKKTKDQFVECYGNFKQAEHILTKRGLLNNIDALFDNDPDRFQAVVDLLEEEFGEKKSKKRLLEALYQGSGTRHEDLTRRGRFRNLDIQDILLLPWQMEKKSKQKKRWLDAGVRVIPGLGNKSEADRLPVESGDEADGARWDNVPDALPQLWNRQCPHAVLKGDGGMGKTVSLICLWQAFTNEPKYTPGKPVPVFIQLNEINHWDKGSGGQGFIADQVNRFYLHRHEMTGKELVNLAKHPLTDGDNRIPALILLLDGFNEITREDKQRQLLLELRDLLEQCDGLQVVVSSRFDMRETMNWSDFHLLELLGMEEEKIKKYLDQRGLPLPWQREEDKWTEAGDRLRQLLQNPMMLTIYASTCEVVREQGNRGDGFKEEAETAGEVLWNFMACQVAREMMSQDKSKEEKWFYHFLLMFLLPALGYEMGKQGNFEMEGRELDKVLKTCCLRFSEDDFLASYREYKKCVKFFAVKGYKEWVVIEKIEKIIEILTDRLCMLVEEGGSYRFLHQDFRDFFAAVHLLNEAEISLSKGEIPGVFKERILDYFVRRLLGEIEGEHRCKPYLVKDEGWKIDINKENRLHKVLDLCRGKFGFREEVGFAVWTVVTIWKEVRGELSGADLSGLDLSGITLNGVRCSRFYEDRYLKAVFDGSRIHEKNLLPRGHSDKVNSAVYSPDGEKIISVSDDQTIKEWDARTGECVKTMAGHSWLVTSAVYSTDGKKILSASWDKTIKEWDAATGKCLKTHQKKDHSHIPGYPTNHKNIKLGTIENKIYVPIYVPDTSGKSKKKTFLNRLKVRIQKAKGLVLINIPGLFIQGCSFQNLEKGSEWTAKGLEILRQYHASVSMG